MTAEAAPVPPRPEPAAQPEATPADPGPVPAPAPEGPAPGPAEARPKPAEPMFSPAMVVPPARLERSKAPPKPSIWSSQPKARRGLSEFQRTAYRMFGNIVARRRADPKTADNLRKARAGIRAEALMSTAMLSGLIGGVVGAMASVFILAVFVPLLGLELPMPMLLLFGMMPAILALGGYMVVMASPGSRAKSRGKDIDNRLPYALNYIAAMASAGVNVDTIFKSLGEQRIYGEVAKEAEAIYRDISLFGKDTVTAFKRAIARTPSQRFAEVLQGAITTFGSGGDLQNYFSSKAQRYMVENRQMQKAYMDTMGLMAETYVTTAVAGPLFLMVMMAIMGLLAGEGPGQLSLVVYLMLPTANFGFVYGLMAMTPKV